MDPHTEQLLTKYREQRDGIRHCPELAGLCLICGSVHIVPHKDNSRKLVCRNCGFAFFRYVCPECSETVDGRDPRNRACPECGIRICSCGACDCPTTSRDERSCP